MIASPSAAGTHRKNHWAKDTPDQLVSPVDAIEYAQTQYLLIVDPAVIQDGVRARFVACRDAASRPRGPSAAPTSGGLGWEGLPLGSGDEIDHGMD